MAASISQREARHLKKRIAELEGLEDTRRNCYASEYPGKHLFTQMEVLPPNLMAIVKTARLLGFAVCVHQRNAVLDYFAVPLLPTKEC